MDDKLAWAFSGGFFIIFMLFKYGERKDALSFTILLVVLLILAIYDQFKKSQPPKVNLEKCNWEQLGLVKNGKYPIFEPALSSSYLRVYSIPLGLGLQDFLDKQTQLETFFHHFIKINMNHVDEKSLLEVTLEKYTNSSV